MRKPRGYWTKQRCKKSAQAYTSKTLWRANEPDAFSAARRRGWISSCCNHMIPGKKPNGYWTKERCKNSAKKFASRTAWQRAYPSAYDNALKNDWLDKCCSHMKRNPPANKIWSEATIIKEAKKYSSRSDWGKKSLGSYIAARRLGIAGRASKHMKRLLKSWTESTLKADARKYLKRSRWRKASAGAYSAAKRLGILGRLTRHMDHPPHNWSVDEVLSSAKRHASIKNWREKSSASYQAAHRLAIVSQAGKHMRRATRTWTNKELLAEAKKYTTRFDWQRQSNSSYQIARRRKILDKACRHMRAVGNRYNRMIYAIENSDRSVYVGLSYDPHRRHLQHINSKSNQTCDKILRQHFQNGSQTLRVFKKKYSLNKVKAQEKRVIQQYFKRGWTILNTAKAGALGMSAQINTLAACIEKAKLCNSRTEFSEKFPSAYNAVCMNGWKKRVFRDLPSKVRSRYTMRELRTSAQKYKTRAEFLRRASKEYRVASLRGVLREITKHMASGKTHRIPDQKVKLAAAQCKTLLEFQTKFPREFGAARRRGGAYFERVASHLKKARIARWTKDLIFEDARNYKTISEWQNKATSQFSDQKTSG